MMPSAGGVFLGVVKRRNSMITDAASPASWASTKATPTPKSLFNGLPPDYAMALPPGSGLGLSIVRTIVHAHAGTVQATPRPEGGLTVTVTLPASADYAVPADD
jgi:hypothetical protein